MPISVRDEAAAPTFDLSFGRRRPTRSTRSAATPVQLLQQRFAATYTGPQSTANDLAFVTLYRPGRCRRHGEHSAAISIDRGAPPARRQRQYDRCAAACPPPAPNPDRCASTRRGDRARPAPAAPRSPDISNGGAQRAGRESTANPAPRRTGSAARCRLTATRRRSSATTIISRSAPASTVRRDPLHRIDDELGLIDPAAAWSSIGAGFRRYAEPAGCDAGARRARRARRLITGDLTPPTRST